jgi:hypothetical protein
MEINASDPKKSKFHVALGKPCRAWPSPNAHVVVDLDGDAKDLPAGFLSGATWKEFYSEEPQPAALPARV